MPAGLTENRTLLEKADLALSDLLSDGGLLNPEQAQKFIRVLIKRAVIMPMATVEPMKSPKKEINKLNFAGRVLRAGQPGVALGVADRAKPDLGPKVELDAKLFKAEVRLNNETLEDSIEMGNLKNTVMQELAKAVSRDMEEVSLEGDVLSADPFLAQLDGIIKQATSNLVNGGTTSLNKGTLRDMLKAMPSEFLVNKANMVYLTSVDAEIDYRDSIANRATPGGDNALGAFATTAADVAYTGIPVKPVPLMPEDLGPGTNETVVLFTDPKNINYGIHREIRMETDKDISSGEIIIVVTMRFDVKYAHELAVVKATAVTVG